MSHLHILIISLILQGQNTSPKRNKTTIMMDVTATTTTRLPLSATGEEVDYLTGASGTCIQGDQAALPSQPLWPTRPSHLRDLILSVAAAGTQEFPAIYISREI